jgi:hypothetical protein
LPTAPENLGDVANIESKHDRYLDPLRLPNCQVNVVPLMNKDSLEMTDPDRVLILGIVRAQCGQLKEIAGKRKRPLSLYWPLSLSEETLAEYVAKNDLQLRVYSGIPAEILITYKLGSTPAEIRPQVFLNLVLV